MIINNCSGPPHSTNALHLRSIIISKNQPTRKCITVTMNSLYIGTQLNRLETSSQSCFINISHSIRPPPKTHCDTCHRYLSQRRFHRKSIVYYYILYSYSVTLSLAIDYMTTCGLLKFSCFTSFHKLSAIVKSCTGLCLHVVANKMAYTCISRLEERRYHCLINC